MRIIIRLLIACIALSAFLALTIITGCAINAPYHVENKEEICNDENHDQFTKCYYQQYGG